MLFGRLNIHVTDVCGLGNLPKIFDKIYRTGELVMLQKVEK